MHSNTDTKDALSLRLSQVAALAAEQERPASDVALELLTGKPTSKTRVAELIKAAKRIAALVPTSEAGETLAGLTDALEALAFEVPICRIDEFGSVEHSVNCECWAPLERTRIGRHIGPWVEVAS